MKIFIKYFGEDKQMMVAIEEMAELTQQLSKHIIGHEKKSRAKVVEEWVDVSIMHNQLKIIFEITDEEISTGKMFKLARISNYILDREELPTPPKEGE